MVKGGMRVSDYSRRNRRSSGNSNNYDDFDWETFDRESSARRRQNAGDGTLKRRRGNDSPRRRTQMERSREAEREKARQARESEYTHQQVKKRKKKRKKQLTEKQLRTRRNARNVILIFVLVCIVVCSGMFVGMYAAVSREIKEMNIQSLALNYTSTIYYTDKNGNEQELDTINSETNRIWVDSSEIAPVFKDAIVSIEDERFEKHNGVDIKRTLGATVKFIGAKLGLGQSSYGGSTITQQVIKNITREDDFKATRKIKEMMRAIALERQLTKDEILTMYCNIVYFANNCNGVEAAAKTYFNKSASELNLQEAASIAGITQFPSQYDPIANPGNNVEKRNIVLRKMLELGKISQQEYETAVAAPLKLSNAYRDEETRVTSYFVDQVINDVIRDLINQKQYSEDFASRQVANGGLKIYSTIDTNVQKIMEDVFEDSSNFPGGDDAEAAMVVLDPYTGQVKGLIGGLGRKTDIRGWNRATQAVRQPGSAIKPLSVYGPAVDLGDITEVDIITDEAITVGNDDWKPKNAYSGFKGDMTIIEAVARSANIPAVKVLDKIGLSNSFAYLQNKFHLTTLKEGDRNYSSLALGGLTQGVTVKEMAAAYGVFVNQGKYITPYTYTKVLDAEGNVILENFVNESQSMDPAAAFITANLLSAPVEMPYGTATRAMLSSGMPTYGKTGTTDDDFDKWFVGFTPYYVGSVWFGFDTPSSLSKAGITGNPCVTAWNMVFDRISQTQSYRELEPPSSVVEAQVCTMSGKLANSSCSSTKSYFVVGTQPKNKCKNHYDRKQSEDFMKGEGTQTQTPTPATKKPEKEEATKKPEETDKPDSATEKPSGGSQGSNNTTGNTNQGSTGGNSATPPPTQAPATVAPTPPPAPPVVQQPTPPEPVQPEAPPSNVGDGVLETE